MWGNLHPTAGFPLRPAADLRTAERCTRKAAPVDGTKSRWLAQVALLCALRRDFPDPLIELAEIARTLAADRSFDPPLDAQLDAWAKNRPLPELREVARLFVSYWADPPAAADKLSLVMPPLTLPVVHLGPRPDTVIDGGWSPMIWEPFEELNPYNPLHPVLAHPNDESLAAFLARAHAHYRERKKTTTSVPRPRVLTQYAFALFLIDKSGWSVDSAAHHLLWLLARFSTVSEWLGNEGAEFRAAYRWKNPPASTLTSWEQFNALNETRTTAQIVADLDHRARVERRLEGSISSEEDL